MCKSGLSHAAFGITRNIQSSLCGFNLSCKKVKIRHMQVTQSVVLWEATNYSVWNDQESL